MSQSLRFLGLKSFRFNEVHAGCFLCCILLLLIFSDLIALCVFAYRSVSCKDFWRLDLLKVDGRGAAWNSSDWRKARKAGEMVKKLLNFSDTIDCWICVPASCQESPFARGPGTCTEPCRFMAIKAVLTARDEQNPNFPFTSDSRRSNSVPSRYSVDLKLTLRGGSPHHNGLHYSIYQVPRLHTLYRRRVVFCPSGWSRGEQTRPVSSFVI